MYIKRKCCFLKPGINPSELKNYNFYTENDGITFWKNLINYNQIVYYSETRRFAFLFPKRSKSKVVLKYIQDLKKANLIEIKKIYIWWTIKNHHYKTKKLIKINERLEKLNEKII